MHTIAGPVVGRGEGDRCVEHRLERHEDRVELFREHPGRFAEAVIFTRALAALRP